MFCIYLHNLEVIEFLSCVNKAATIKTDQILIDFDNQEEIDKLMKILKCFFYCDRYRNKCINHNDYVIRTVKKIISYVLRYDLIGSFLLYIGDDVHSIINFKLKTYYLTSFYSIIFKMQFNLHSY
uniref:hypothetical protein n=1 Tax=Gracilaria urvillei TaxID=172974 RepID=UPI001D0FA550|nr:hypothetical protein LK147_pgp120 [Hydropuntia urvillei]UAD88420.1 hypothetical protein [Hydropuntia urvillei]